MAFVITVMIMGNLFNRIPVWERLKTVRQLITVDTMEGIIAVGEAEGIIADIAEMRRYKQEIV